MTDTSNTPADPTRVRVRKLSTGHLPLSDLAILDAGFDVPRLHMIDADERTTCCYLFRAHFDSVEDLRETRDELAEFGFSFDALHGLLAACFAEGCDYLLLDADADTSDEFPIYPHT